MPQVDRETILHTLNSLEGEGKPTDACYAIRVMLKLLDPELYAAVQAVINNDVVWMEPTTRNWVWKADAFRRR
jgi:hypothetical protein